MFLEKWIDEGCARFRQNREYRRVARRDVRVFRHGLLQRAQRRERLNTPAGRVQDRLERAGYVIQWLLAGMTVDGQVVALCRQGDHIAGMARGVSRDQALLHLAALMLRRAERVAA